MSVAKLKTAALRCGNMLFGDVALLASMLAQLQPAECEGR